MKLKFRRYNYVNPSKLSLNESFYADNYDNIISAAGFDLEDDEIVLCELKEEWNGHPSGSLVGQD